eukprot:gnl/Dysnectes_brevis/2682_a3248_773.p1 GENE.gnl/Dysnectes_brevis/2682_a3248_773~~gnl/Dysnectes_brevis/2682_a3248_773.p1  ORF type:complete len:1333 (-),score=34.34 gnl/Dysnectes_brevis/2682_a3248_773:98-3568(-)
MNRLMFLSLTRQPAMIHTAGSYSSDHIKQLLLPELSPDTSDTSSFLDQLLGIDSKLARDQDQLRLALTSQIAIPGLKEPRANPDPEGVLSITESRHIELKCPKKMKKYIERFLLLPVQCTALLALFNTAVLEGVDTKLLVGVQEKRTKNKLPHTLETLRYRELAFSVVAFFSGMGDQLIPAKPGVHRTPIRPILNPKAELFPELICMEPFNQPDGTGFLSITISGEIASCLPSFLVKTTNDSSLVSSPFPTLRKNLKKGTFVKGFLSMQEVCDLGSRYDTLLESSYPAVTGSVVIACGDSLSDFGTVLTDSTTLNVSAVIHCPFITEPSQTVCSCSFSFPGHFCKTDTLFHSSACSTLPLLCCLSQSQFDEAILQCLKMLGICHFYIDSRIQYEPIQPNRFSRYDSPSDLPTKTLELSPFLFNGRRIQLPDSLRPSLVRPISNPGSYAIHPPALAHLRDWVRAGIGDPGCLVGQLCGMDGIDNLKSWFPRGYSEVDAPLGALTYERVCSQLQLQGAFVCYVGNSLSSPSHVDTALAELWKLSQHLQPGSAGALVIESSTLTDSVVEKLRSVKTYHIVVVKPQCSLLSQLTQIADTTVAAEQAFGALNLLGVHGKFPGIISQSFDSIVWNSLETNPSWFDVVNVALTDTFDVRQEVNRLVDDTSVDLIDDLIVACWLGASLSPLKRAIPKDHADHFQNYRVCKVIASPTSDDYFLVIIPAYAPSVITRMVNPSLSGSQRGFYSPSFGTLGLGTFIDSPEFKACLSQRETLLPIFQLIDELPDTKDMFKCFEVLLSQLSKLPFVCAYTSAIHDISTYLKNQLITQDFRLNPMLRKNILKSLLTLTRRLTNVKRCPKPLFHITLFIASYELRSAGLESVIELSDELATCLDALLSDRHSVSFGVDASAHFALKLKTCKHSLESKHHVFKSKLELARTYSAQLSYDQDNERVKTRVDALQDLHLQPLFFLNDEIIDPKTLQTKELFSRHKVYDPRAMEHLPDLSFPSRIPTNHHTALPVWFHSADALLENLKPLITCIFTFPIFHLVNEDGDEDDDWTELRYLSKIEQLDPIDDSRRLSLNTILTHLADRCTSEVVEGGFKPYPIRTFPDSRLYFCHLEQEGLHMLAIGYSVLEDAYSSPTSARLGLVVPYIPYPFIKLF